MKKINKTAEQWKAPRSGIIYAELVKNRMKVLYSFNDSEEIPEEWIKQIVIRNFQ